MTNNARITFAVPDEQSDINDISMGIDLDYSDRIVAPDGHDLALIAFIPIDKLVAIAPEFTEYFQDVDHENTAIYVFSYYDKEGYFLDCITEIDLSLQGYTKVVVADKNAFKSDLSKFNPVRLVDEPDGISFFSGTPEYLQNEGYDFSDEYIFIGQFIGMELPKKHEDIFYLPASVGYLFLKKDLSGGLFFTEAT